MKKVVFGFTNFVAFGFAQTTEMSFAQATTKDSGFILTTERSRSLSVAEVVGIYVAKTTSQSTKQLFT